ncbi:PAS domain-containing protein [Clostridiaceae bacterium HSG29]|nr:PAS domain-containing protein [Clostridiaceae bacterium HSG29]
MSEYLSNEKRVNALLEFSNKMMNGGNGVELIKEYQEAINHVTPNDMLKLEDMQIEADVSVAKIKGTVDKVINVFYKKLSDYNWDKPKKGTFLYYLMKENEELSNKLNDIKVLLKKGNIKNDRNELLISFKELTQIETHYVKKENILFPYLENKLERYHALNVMWSLHDDARKKIKSIIKMLDDTTIDEKKLQIEIGEAFFLLFGLIQKENLIVYPVASEAINEKDFKKMHLQSFEYEFAFIDTPEKPEETKEENSLDGFDGYLLKTDTGMLTAEQVLLTLNNLPLDITVVDENNKVRFFSKPDERFFPRSPAIIGRDVKNCHPPESVHIVERIVEAFKNGEKDNAKFWLTLKGKFILIQYFAIRNDKNEYKGVIEVSQDVTEIRNLEGTQTLLDWDK